jgi:hypothetical protein
MIGTVLDFLRPQVTVAEARTRADFTALAPDSARGAWDRLVAAPQNRWDRLDRWARSLLGERPVARVPADDAVRWEMLLAVAPFTTTIDLLAHGQETWARVNVLERSAVLHSTPDDITSLRQQLPDQVRVRMLDDNPSWWQSHMQ